MNKPTRGLGVVAALVVTCAVGCATTESFLAAPIAPQAGDPIVAGGLLVHASEDRGLAAPNFGVVQVIFENRSPSWLRLSNLSLNFGTPTREAAVHVPTGNELADWQRAISSQARLQADDTDAALVFLGFLGLFSAIAGIASDSPGLALTGDLALETSAAALDIRQHQKMVEAIERPPMLPDTHLLAGDGFGIPPGLSTTRWVVIQTRNGMAEVLKNVRLDYNTEDGVRRSVRLVFRSGSCQSQWQRDLCEWRNTQ